MNAPKLQQNSFSTRKSLVAGLVLLLAFIITAGIIGLYTLNKSFTNSEEYIDAIDSARETQVLIQKQIQIWKTTILESDDYDQYRKLFYEFSRYSTVIQDMLFNLKITCSSFEETPDEIMKLSELHKQLSEEYILLLVNLEESGFRNKKTIIDAAKGKDARIFDSIDRIVGRIKNHSHYMMDRINKFYLAIVFAVLLIMIFAAVSLSIYLSRRIFRAQYILEKKVSERTKDLVDANRKIKLSEEKYRLIVEGSRDIIFSLDESLKFITVNRTVYEFFKVKPEKVEGKNFFDIINSETPESHFTIGLIKEKISHLMANSGTTQFIADIKIPGFIESIALNVKLESLNFDDKKEILGHAAPAVQDTIVNYLVRERRKFRIDNSLIAADDMSLKLTAGLSKILDDSEVKITRIALREIMINAIEHGNLNISFMEKSTAMIKDEYFKLLKSRQLDPKYRDKKIEIEYTFDHDKVVYRITDEGNGFDHNSMVKRSINRINDGMITHGRGIAMARQIFDHLRYNEKGNEVLLVKYFNQCGTAAG
ncbi:MAG TPA: ATP-binding protein [Spirochaetota bacterium]|nr:ATP-binding protein [Spirochaetota bacterium]HPI88200.1 ATP-binding protein [Spirochaetota bacterium]HPR47255.1 ATP-binding protein [Spirochaetota bacterium]